MPVSLIERFRDRLPLEPDTPVVSLGEGSTPLLRAPRLSERLGVELWLKRAGAVAPGKLAQARAVGARVDEVAGGFGEAFAAARDLAERPGHVLVNSVNPDRLEGQKTAAFEVVEELGRAPDVLALPYGGGGNLCAYARGFAEDGARPRLLAGEATERATTAASAIRIGEPVHRAEAEEQLARS